MKFIPLLIAFFIATPAFASVSFTQVPSGDVQNPVSVQVTIDSPADLDADTLSTPYWFVEIWGGTDSAVLATGCVPTTDASGVYTFSGNVPLANYDTVAIAGTATCTSPNAGEVITQAVNFTVIDTPTAGGGISFIDYADITPQDMLASVRQGTVDTADKTLPLLVFLGIPLGFLLVLFLIGLINKTLTPETSTTSRRGNGRGWTAHGAMEHDLTEFKKKERSRIKRDL